MPQAIWNDTVIAETDTFETVEGNIYFPKDSIKSEYFHPSDHTSICPWKGTAHYYTIQIGEATNKDAAWYYPAPKEKAAQIKDMVAFWKGVKVAK